MTVVTHTENFIIGNCIVKRFFQGEKIVHEEILAKVFLNSAKNMGKVKRQFEN